MTVIQTGSIALLAFIFGDYLSQIWNLGPLSSSLYASAIIIFFTGLNLLGVRQGKTTQNFLTVCQLIGLLIIIAIGLSFTATPANVSPTPLPQAKSIGLAMMFVLLAYGGWNEAAFISAEIQNRDRNIIRSLLWSIGIITIVYLLVSRRR